jgi:hypothetical protein
VTLAFASALVLSACVQSGDLFHAGPCRPWITSIPPEQPASVDLLLAIDGSRDMAEVRASFVAQLPQAVVALTSGDHDHDGVAEHAPVTSLHVGVISTDMGTGDAVAPGCASGFGDDGILRRTGCDSFPSGIFAFTGTTDLATADELACATALEDSDCAFVEALEAPLKALSLPPTMAGTSPVDWTRPGYRPPTFAGSPGHGGGGGPNEGFLRPDAVLVVLIVTNEDDCSSPDPSVYGAAARNCRAFSDRLQPIERYVDGFIGLRAQPDRLLFAAIAGIPLDPGTGSYDEVLAMPELTERIDPENPSALLPSCTSSTGFSARPPRRLLEVANGLSRLGADTSFRSICDTNPVTNVDALLAHIAARVGRSCLDGVRVYPDGSIACELIETLAPEGTPAVPVRCEELPMAGVYEDVGDGGDGSARQAMCRVRRIDPLDTTIDVGWYYDDGSHPTSPAAPECQGTVGLRGIELAPGARFSVRCYEEPELWPPALPACDPGSGAIVGTSQRCSDLVGTGAAELACDDFTLHCGMPCRSSDDCASSTFCDLHTASELFQGARPERLAPSAVRGFCATTAECR